MNFNEEELKKMALNPFTYTNYSINCVMLLLFKAEIISQEQYEKLLETNLKEDEMENLLSESVKRTIEWLKEM